MRLLHNLKEAPHSYRGQVVSTGATRRRRHFVVASAPRAKGTITPGLEPGTLIRSRAGRELIRSLMRYPLRHAIGVFRRQDKTAMTNEVRNISKIINTFNKKKEIEPEGRRMACRGMGGRRVCIASPRNPAAAAGGGRHGVRRGQLARSHARARARAWRHPSRLRLVVCGVAPLAAATPGPLPGQRGSATRSELSALLESDSESQSHVAEWGEWTPPPEESQQPTP